MRIIIIVCLILATQMSSFGNSYTLDSLVEIYKLETNTSKKVDFLIEIGAEYIKEGKSDSSIIYFNRALCESQKAESNVMISKSYNSIGAFHLNKWDNRSAITNFKKALLNITISDDSAQFAGICNNIGIAYHRLGIIDSAILVNRYALKIYEQQNDSLGIANITNNIGVIYHENGDFDLALKYFNQAMNIRKGLSDSTQLAYAYHNLAYTYTEKNEYNKAINLFNKSIHLKSELGDTVALAASYNCLGIIYIKTNLNKLAIDYLDKAFKIYDNYNKLEKKALVLSNIALANYQMGNIELAEQKYHQAISYFENKEANNTLVNIYKGLSDVKRSLEKYEAAMMWLDKHYVLKDSLYTIEKEKVLYSTEANYIAQKKEKENKELLKSLEAKKTKLRLQKTIVGLLLILAAILTVFVIFIKNKQKELRKLYYIQKKKNSVIQNQARSLWEVNKKQDELIKFKESMANMIVHDLKSPLNTIINYNRMPDLPNSREIIEYSGNQMLNLVMNMLDVQKYEDTEIKLSTKKINLEKLLKNVVGEFEFIIQSKKVAMTFDFNRNIYVKVDESIFRRIFVNLISNSLKFAPNNSEVIVKASLDENDAIKISLLNEGPGIPKHMQESIFHQYNQADRRNLGKMESTGLGLSFCKMAVEAHGGKIGVISEKETGVEFWMTFPGASIKHNQTIHSLVTGDLNKKFA